MKELLKQKILTAAETLVAFKNKSEYVQKNALILAKITLDESVDYADRFKARDNLNKILFK